jgi:hypothetical protein
MKAILIINPKSGETKREMPPILKWTLKKLEKRVAEVFVPIKPNIENFQFTSEYNYYII